MITASKRGASHHIEYVFDIATVRQKQPKACTTTTLSAQLTTDNRTICKKQHAHNFNILPYNSQAQKRKSKVCSNQMTLFSPLTFQLLSIKLSILLIIVLTLTAVNVRKKVRLT